MKRQLLRARWVVPVGEPPREDGLIEVVDGRVTSVRSFAGDADRCQELIDLGDVAVLPALVNAHTHLELSDFEQPLAVSGTFTNWVKQIAPYRTERTAEAATNAVAKGLAETTQGGVAAVGDIVQISEVLAISGGFAPQHDTQQIKVLQFVELLGLSPIRYAANLDTLRQISASARRRANLGISPHATYTVHPDLLTACVELACEYCLPLAMHVAESADEVELISGGSGPLKEFFVELGIWKPDLFPPRRDFSYWLETLAKAPRSLIVHGNHLRESEWQLLAENRNRQAVVYCPRTHAAFGHPLYPLREMLDAGATVAVGTDSRASNPDLHLWRELQTINETHPDVSTSEILEMGTCQGARALGLEDQYGEIAPGRRAAFCVVELPGGTLGADPIEDILRSPKLPNLCYF